MKAIEQDIAGRKLSYGQIYDQAKTIIKKSRAITGMMMKKGFIRKTK